MRKRGSRIRANRTHLTTLWHRHDGFCTKCGELTGMVYELVKEGWVYNQKTNRLYFDDLIVRVATVEHIVPVALGGLNTIINMTLLCYDCNQENGVEFNNYLVDTKKHWRKPSLIAKLSYQP